MTTQAEGDEALAGVDLGINAETVQFIIDQAHAFQMVGQGDRDDSVEGPDPSFDELKATIDDLEPDQQVALVALTWLGRGDYGVEEFSRALADAGDSWNERSAEYLIGTPLLADYLTEAMDQLGFTTG